MSNELPKEVEKILPEDVINTLQSAYHVFKGEQDQIDDLLKNGSALLRKASQRFTTTQLIIGVAVLASVAIFATAKIAEAASDEN